MKRNFILSLMFSFLFFLITDSSIGTTVIMKSFEQVATEAELIFEGQVLSKETRPSPISGMPFTYFTFEIIDVIKGDYPDPTIEMGFMGGTLGDETLSVSGMRMPDVGEKGIYFVQTTIQQYVHPLSGWQQGHYLIMGSEQTGTDTVVPVIRKGAPNSLSRAATLPTIEDFKQNIRNAIRGEQ